MKPLLVLLGVFGISSIIILFISGHWNLKLGGIIAMSAMLLFTSVGHFAFPDAMANMLPATIPFRKEIIWLTGLMEALFAIALLIPASRATTAIGLVIFFVLLLPANIYAAIHHINFQRSGERGPGPSYLWFRIPLQILFISWVYWFAYH